MLLMRHNSPVFLLSLCNMEFKRGEYLISDDKSLLNVQKVHGLLTETYWAQGRSLEDVRSSIRNSLCFGLYIDNIQIGFGRFISDQSVISWFGDFIIEEKYRAIGLGKWMLECMLSHPEIKNTKVILATKDAHSLYEKYGFEQSEFMLLDLN